MAMEFLSGNWDNLKNNAQEMLLYLAGGRCKADIKDKPANLTGTSHAPNAILSVSKFGLWGENKKIETFIHLNEEEAASDLANKLNSAPDNEDQATATLALATAYKLYFTNDAKKSDDEPNELSSVIKESFACTKNLIHPVEAREIEKSVTRALEPQLLKRSL